METKWASLVSYGLTVEALTDFLPLEVTLDMQTVRHDALKVAQRCEDELGEEPRGVGDGCQRDWERFPSPDGPIIVGIDGGYVRNWDTKKRHFEVIVGKSTLALPRDNDHEAPAVRSGRSFRAGGPTGATPRADCPCQPASRSGVHPCPSDEGVSRPRAFAARLLACGSRGFMPPHDRHAVRVTAGRA